MSDLNIVDLARAGPMLENHPLFPQRVNISFAQVVSRNHVNLKVWERGVGLTKACGTAACAVMAAGHRIKIIDADCTVTLPGGNLIMNVRAHDGHVLMTGPSVLEYQGVLPEALLP